MLRMTRAPLSLSGLWVLAVMGDRTSDLVALRPTASGCAAGIRISF
jgi:hypothetical protein